MKRMLYRVVPLVILIVAIGLRLGQKRADLNAQARERSARLNAAPNVSVASVQVQDIPQTFESIGTVDAPLAPKIGAKVTGRITYLAAHEGDRVRRGQVLVRIDPSQIVAQVQQQEATLEEARFHLTQAKITQNPNDVNVLAQISQQEAGLATAQADYNQVNTNYQAQIDTAKAGVKSARANLTDAQAKHKRYQTLYAKGFVASQDVDDTNAALGVQEAAVEAAEKQVEIVTRTGDASRQDALAKVKQAQAALDYARANRAQTPAYRENLAALQAEVVAAEAALKNLRSQLQDTVLVCPLDGFVTSRYVDPGTVVTAGQSILAVQYMQEVWVTVSVPEDVSAKLRTGLPARVTFDALRGQKFAGSVTQFNPSADPTSRDFTVRVTLANPGNAIKPGTYAHVAIELGRVRDAIVVPREAIQRGPEGSYAIVVDAGNVAHRRRVTLGASGTNVIAVTAGVRPGEKVLTLAAFPIKDGQSVSIGGARKGSEKAAR
jgi:RND family efflux transporter MFP subunit